MNQTTNSSNNVQSEDNIFEDPPSSIQASSDMLESPDVHSLTSYTDNSNNANHEGDQPPPAFASPMLYPSQAHKLGLLI